MVSAIYGLGGIGKSTLAAALAHDEEVQSHFPDGIFWATLGQQPDILSFLSTWIQALKDYDFKPINIDSASLQLRTLLSDKKALLVVDDVWHPDHVEPFRVAGGGCRVLVTTREAPVKGDPYYLDVMTLNQSLELLTGYFNNELTNQELDYAKILAKTVGYLPLRLELAAAQVRDGFSWEELLSELQPEIPAECCHQVLYRRLNCIKKISIILFLALISTSALFIYIKDKSTKYIQQANQIITTLNDSGLNLTEVELNQKKQDINKTIFWLDKVPKLPHIPYQEAQEKKQSIRQIANDIETKNINNKIAKDILKEARDTLQKFGEIKFSEPNPVSYWQDSKDVLSQVIESLKKAPTNTSDSVQKQVSDTLEEYKSQLSQVINSLNSEKKAINDLREADNLKQLGSEVLNQSKPSIDSLENAISNLNDSINILGKLPSNVTVSQNNKNKIDDSKQVLDSLENKLEEARRNACPHSYEYFQKAINKVSVSQIHEGKILLSQITNAYEDARCKELRAQVQNSLLLAWENHYHKEFNQLRDFPLIQGSVFCQPLDDGCPERARNAKVQAQRRIRELNEERNDKINTIRSRLR